MAITQREKNGRPNVLQGADLIEVIRVEFIDGVGSEADPVRVITRYFAKDGQFLAEADPIKAMIKAREGRTGG